MPALARVLPLLEDESISPEWRGASVSAAAYEDGVVYPFDWPAWTKPAKAHAYEARPELLASADLDTCRRLLTCYVRAERFTDGVLASMVSSGYLQQLVRRLLELSETTDWEPHNWKPRR
jgi:hypothetical protein